MHRRIHQQAQEITGGMGCGGVGGTEAERGESEVGKNCKTIAGAGVWGTPRMGFSYQYGADGATAPTGGLRHSSTKPGCSKGAPSVREWTRGKNKTPNADFFQVLGAPSRERPPRTHS